MAHEPVETPNLIESIAHRLGNLAVSPGLTTQERILRQILIVLAPAGVLFGTGALFAGLGPVSWYGAATGFSTLPLFSLAIWLARRRSAAAAWIPPLVILLVASLVNSFFGLGHFIYVGYVLAVVTAVILLGYRPAALLAAIAVASHFLTGYSQSYRLSPLAYPPTETIIPDGLGLSLGLFLTILLLSLYRRETATAVSMERSRAQWLDEKRTDLEQQLVSHAQDLERRLVQLHTAAEITQAIGQSFDPHQVLEETARLVQERFNLYYVGIFLVDGRGEYAVLNAGTGEAGKQLMAAGHKLAIGGDSMIGQCTVNRLPRIAQDVDQESRRFQNPYLPHTRAELAIPILSGETLLGAVSIQSDQPQAFDEEDILVLQSITAALGSALEKSRLLAEVQGSLQEIERLHQQYLAHAWEEAEALQSGPLEFTFEGDPAAPGDHTLHLPIALHNQVIGSLELETGQASLSTEAKRLVESVANQAALALENARLLQEAQNWAARERIINAMTENASRSLDLDSLLKAAVRELGQLPHVNEVSVHVGPPDLIRPARGSAR